MADASSIKRYGDLGKIVPQCMGCRNPADGTIVLAHRNRNGWGLLAGRGIKSVSISGAFLCSVCHAWADSDGQNDSEFWELASGRSLTWSWRAGYLNFNAKGGDPDHALR